jgi:hypothetical protein
VPSLIVILILNAIIVLSKVFNITWCLCGFFPFNSSFKLTFYWVKESHVNIKIIHNIPYILYSVSPNGSILQNNNTQAITLWQSYSDFHSFTGTCVCISFYSALLHMYAHVQTTTWRYWILLISQRLLLFPFHSYIHFFLTYLPPNTSSSQAHYTVLHFSNFFISRILCKCCINK